MHRRRHITSTGIRSGAVGVAGLLALAGCTTTTPTASPSVTPSGSVGSTVTPDFDGDGEADLAIGVNRRVRRGVLVLAVALVLAGCTATAPTPAPTTPAGPTASPSRPAVHTEASPDFDGDGGADLVVGAGSDPGRVSVRYANGEMLDFTRKDVDSDPAHAASADFGQALLARDLNRDGYTDLVVSDPGTEFGLTLFVLYGGPKGLDPADPVSVSTQVSPGAGRVLAYLNGDKPLLVAGGAGDSVLAWSIGADGRPAGEPTTMSPETLGLPASAPGSQFGTSLAASGTVLVLGAPGETVNNAKRAGAIYVVDVGEDPVKVQRITEDTPGVPDNAQAGDRFGAAVAAGRGYVAVGAPGDDRKDEHGRLQPGTGMVVAFQLNANGALWSPRAYDQRALPGNVEAGDGFGATLAMASFCADSTGMIVGAWAEAIGTREQAGSVWLVGLGNDGCGWTQLYDGAGLGAKARANTLVGSAVSVLDTGDSGNTLVIAAQGNAEEGVPGRVLTLDTPYDDPPNEVFTDLAVKEERTIALSPPEG